MAARSFVKMHGAGNDFVVIDARDHTISLTTAQLVFLADRHKGVGCDQLVVIEPSAVADCFMRIYNADGSSSATCGNATRCVADILFKDYNKQQVVIETLAGILTAKRAENNHITVNMGQARLRWDEIPLASEMDTLSLPVETAGVGNPVAVSMGNPHAVFFVQKAAIVPLAAIGPILEYHPLFPERANIGIAEVLAPDTIILRVWERGAGETLACGSGACAALVAASRRGLTGRKATVQLQGGNLVIEWLENGEVLMTGEAVTSFKGEVEF